MQGRVVVPCGVSITGPRGRHRPSPLVQAGRLGTDVNTLRYGNVLRGLDHGILAPPRLPQATIRRMVRLLNQQGEPLLFGQDRVEVRRVTLPELATLGRFR